MHKLVFNGFIVDFIVKKRMPVSGIEPGPIF